MSPQVSRAASRAPRPLIERLPASEASSPGRCRRCTRQARADLRGSPIALSWSVCQRGRLRAAVTPKSSVDASAVEAAPPEPTGPLKADWRSELCDCLRCQVRRLSASLPSLPSEAAGTYVLTRTHTAAWPRLCHPDGCPSDPCTSSRIDASRTVVLPEPGSAHRAADRADLCVRVACARLPAHQRR